MDLQPTSAKLMSYSGESIRPLGKVTLFHQSPQFYMLMDFHVVDLPCKPASLGETRIRSNPGSRTDHFDWEGHKIKGNQKKTPRKCPFGQKSESYNTRGR